MLPVSRVPPPSRRAPNWSSEGAHTWEHHPQPTIPPPRLNRQAESRRQAVGCISRGRARPYTRRKDRPTLIPGNQVSEGEGTMVTLRPIGYISTHFAVGHIFFWYKLVHSSRGITDGWSVHKEVEQNTPAITAIIFRLRNPLLEYRVHRRASTLESRFSIGRRWELHYVSNY